jgi:uncharacterized protein (DUF1499 family)
MKILVRFIQIVVGLVIALGLLSIFMAILSRFVKRPDNVGLADGHLAPCPNMPNCVSTRSEDPRHQIDPLRYRGSTENSQEVLIDVIHSMDRSVIVEEKPGYIYAEFRTKGAGYIDDVEFVFIPENRIIHFRSSSRLPYYDWGVNRNRMETIREAFTAATSSLNEPGEIR